MKITLDFAELSNVLGYANTVLSDKSVDDKMKNVIFMVSPEEVRVVGYNAFTFSRTVLEKATVLDIPETGWEFQLKAQELNKIVASFSNLYKTTVNTLDIEEEGVKVKIIVHEEAIKEEDSQLNRDSRFVLENAPILTNVSKEIHKEFPEGQDMVVSADLLLYLDSLYPLMTNDSANSMGSKLNFAEDYVFSVNSYMSAFFVNKLPDAFKDITLTYSSVGFLKKLCEDAQNIGVAKEDKYLCIGSGNTEAFMRYQKVRVNYKMFVEKKTKEKGFVIDRLYLKDVLRRMSSFDADGKMSVGSDKTLTVVNKNFSQQIPLNNVKPGSEGISFNVPIAILDKCIIGKDDVFGSDLFVYFADTARGYLVYIQDKTGAWFSTTQVSKTTI